MTDMDTRPDEAPEHTGTVKEWRPPIEERVLNPQDVERLLAQLANRIARGVPIVSKAHEDYLNAKRAYDLAYARAFLDAGGAQGAKRYAATIATEAERTAMDQAEIVYKRALSNADAIESAMSGVQSIGASVRMMFQGQASGHGGWS